ncbi:MAG TPA: hypothetical protein VJ697_06175 [Nitrososphaeraceae archaeon]|nr:hypothetical protein [Nitrososphaeraceae archaeon]
MRMVDIKGCHLEQNKRKGDIQARTTMAGNTFEKHVFVILVRFLTLYMDIIYRLN